MRDRPRGCPACADARVRGLVCPCGHDEGLKLVRSFDERARIRTEQEASPIVPTYVDLHFKRDERGRPQVCVLGFEGTGPGYRWAMLTTSGWSELPRGSGPQVATSFFYLEGYDERLTRGRPRIGAPSIVSDDGRRCAPLGTWSGG